MAEVWGEDANGNPIDEWGNVVDQEPAGDGMPPENVAGSSIRLLSEEEANSIEL